MSSSNDAQISDCGRYRYSLTRRWGQGDAIATFILRNSSSGNARVGDSVTHRCATFAHRADCDGMVVVSLYAWRASRAADLWQVPDPVGPDNDQVIRRVLAQAANTGAPVIAAWGTGVRPDRPQVVLDLAENVSLLCLGMTKAGHPRHPLNLPKDTPLVQFPGGGLPHSRS